MSGEDKIDFRLLAEYSVDIICSVGVNHVIRYVSPSSIRILGWSPEQMIGTLFDDYVFEGDSAALRVAETQIISPGVDNAPSVLRLRKADGNFVWIGTNARAVRDRETGDITEFVLVMRDISERKALEEKLSELALTDGLTGIANRRAFDQSLEREWQRTLRDGSQLSLLLLDIDHFKTFNDQYGHQVGDDCLRAVAIAVREAVRATDIVARYGGEEIAIILPNTEAAGALEAAEKVRLAVERLKLFLPAECEGEPWVTASIGAATVLARYGGTMKSPESLLLAADNALYKAKHGGRNRVANALVVASSEKLPSTETSSELTANGDSDGS